MIVIFLFWGFVAGACLYAARYGGRDGRWAAALILIGVLLTFIAQLHQSDWRQINHAVMIVDLIIWVGFMAFMIKSQRYFPLWMAAAQTNTLITHFAILIAAAFNHQIYAGFATIWSIPCLISMIGGIALDRNAGIRL